MNTAVYFIAAAAIALGAVSVSAIALSLRRRKQERLISAVLIHSSLQRILEISGEDPPLTHARVAAIRRAGGRPPQGSESENEPTDDLRRLFLFDSEGAKRLMGRRASVASIPIDALSEPALDELLEGLLLSRVKA